MRPIITCHNTAKDKKYQRDLAPKTCSKIFLKKMNKTGLQDNYMGSFDIDACSKKYFTIMVYNGKIDNVTIE